MRRKVRSEDQISRHYAIEKSLASRLRNAPAEDRRRLYPQVYRELYRRVPDHPDLVADRFEQSSRATSSHQVKLLRPYLTKDTTFMEIGAGDARLAHQVARFTRRAYALDIGFTRFLVENRPTNLLLLGTDGFEIPLRAKSVDVAYCNQVIEHLHPDDAPILLKEVFRTLAPGGVFICVTPHRFRGPHDISGVFDTEPSGLHLKEYTILEMRALLAGCGFTGIVPFYPFLGWSIRFPLQLTLFFERVLDNLSPSVRRLIASSPPQSVVFGIRLVAHKPPPRIAKR
jgi:SAM-dependent methyltransferase